MRTAGEDDALLLWAAQGLVTGARAWSHGSASAVASPGASARDRLAVRGSVADAVPLVRHVLAESGPGYRPVGDTRLITALVERIPELSYVGAFGWMDTTGPELPRQTRPGPVADWLGRAELPEAAALLDRHFPSSYAHPERPGATAWAGIRDDRGRLTAIAADAWSAPEIGLLAGVATHPEHGRGRGHAEAVCRFVLDSLLRRSGRAALMVDESNTPAIRLYRRLGLRWRGISAAACR